MTISICTAQLNLTAGDIEGNTRKILQAAAQASARGARLLLTPELGVCGYLVQDLLLRPSFQQACDDALDCIVRASRDWPELTLVVGHPQAVPCVGAVTAVLAPAIATSVPVAAPELATAVELRDVREQGCAVRRHNAVSVIRNGDRIAVGIKQCLPSYGVFDEERHFVAGSGPCVVDVAGLRVGILICEDAWTPGPAQAARDGGAQLLVSVNASPFHAGKQAQREAVLRQRVQETGLPLVCAHMVGGQDDVVFDGGSMALDAAGRVVMRTSRFVEALSCVEVDMQPSIPGAAPCLRPAQVAPNLVGEAELWQALVLAVRDYVSKNRFPGVLLGLSGGIDSALVLAIAVDALGADKVRTVMMPSPYTADISWQDAREMASRLGVRHDVIDIAPLFDAFRQALAPHFAGLPPGLAEENLQARCRGTLLMGLSNKTGAVVLTTGNKSEMATGYCTLYGDMAGGFAVICDVLKTRVFELARWRNANDPFGTGSNPIPERIITRPPSAELRPDQRDEDSLPPYPVLDDIISRYVEHDEPVSAIVAAGHARELVEQVTRLIRTNEYKRGQAPVGPRVSPRSFGRDWRMPVTNGFRG